MAPLPPAPPPPAPAEEESLVIISMTMFNAMRIFFPSVRPGYDAIALTATRDIASRNSGNTTVSFSCCTDGFNCAAKNAEVHSVSWSASVTTPASCNIAMKSERNKRAPNVESRDAYWWNIWRSNSEKSCTAWWMSKRSSCT